MNPLLHDIYFVFADRLMGSDDLAVDIRQTDLVIVNEIKGADSAAGKGFDDIAADSADAWAGRELFETDAEGKPRRVASLPRSNSVLENSFNIDVDSFSYNYI